ncbi:class I SAM-dependent methyltransferase [Nitrosomonas nitrosa]|uniref:class I SAM-dependent methyltransferase n=1 Tax=Nitrosomonas nitrosa TaxID=52442 RepID=UPI0023F76996|nr:class I SAM-dependent methyltransferase [Nitrosomonas nitrosa]MCO6432675.1 class I SAM-dependent methyltransferase [Nitrosomonas nitrosa]
MAEPNLYHDYHKWLKARVPFGIQKQLSLFDNYYRRNYAKLLPHNKNANITELACGLGQFLHFLRNQGYTNVSGVDIDSNNVSMCHQYGFNDVIAADMFDYIKSLDDVSVDVFILNDIIEHLNKREAKNLLQQMHGKLNSGGSVLIKTCNCNNIYGLAGLFSDFTHQEGYTPIKMEHLAALCGYKECQSYNLFIYPNIPLVDEVWPLPFWLTYKVKKLRFLINGKAREDVFSKNFLAQIKK